MSNLDEEFENLSKEIQAGVENFRDDEQNIIRAWTVKLSEPAESENQKAVRNEYARALSKMIDKNEGLQNPFTDFPPEEELAPMKVSKEPSVGGGRSPSPEKHSPPGTRINSPRGFSPGRRVSPAKEGSVPGEREGEGKTSGQQGSREVSPTRDKQQGGEKPKFNYVRLPCAKRPGEGTGAIPKTKKPSPVAPEYFEANLRNEFEEPEEMARVIARSKGQSFAEFIGAISRHTADFGQELRAAMKVETGNFREYVDHVLSQRIKDLTEVLNEEQNAELQKIKKDIDKWQLELSHCKKRIKDMIPDFDLNQFKKDKNYLKRVFAVDFTPGLPQDESSKLWKDEARHRLNWYCEMINKMMRCNDRLMQELDDINNKMIELEAQESLRFQNCSNFINTAMSECQKFKAERDRLRKENNCITSKIQELGV